MMLSMTTYVGSSQKELRRLEFLKKSMATFVKTDFPAGTVIRIIDDGSKNTEVRKVLGSLKFPSHVRVLFEFKEKNSGCDETMMSNMRWCLDHCDDEFIITCDSDVLYNREWINKLIDAREKLIDEKIAMLTCFDTRNHAKVRHVTPDIIEKESCGGFCALINRKVLLHKDMTVEVWDHRVKAIAKKEGMKFFCTDPSYVQHQGFGKSAMGLSWDTAWNFVGLPE